MATRARLIPWASASPAGRPHSAAERVERLDDPHDGPQQAEQRPERRHGAQDPEVPLQLDDLAGRVVAEDLADRRARLAPGIDHHREDPRRRGIVCPAELQGALAVELPAGEPLEEPIGELARDHPIPAQGHGPFEHVAQREDRADHQRPEHRIGPEHQLNDARPIHPRSLGRRGVDAGRDTRTALRRPALEPGSPGGPRRHRSAIGAQRASGSRQGALRPAMQSSRTRWRGLPVIGGRPPDSQPMHLSPTHTLFPQWRAASTCSHGTGNG